MTKMNLQKIDALYLADHYKLDTQDVCYFFGDYLPRKGYDKGPLNQLISNFKIKPHVKKDQPYRWKYKGEAIREVAVELSKINNLINFTWIPIPSSKLLGDPNYDNRVVETLEVLISLNPESHYEDILSFKRGHTALHEGGDRNQIADLMEISSNIINSPRKTFLVFDDMLTTGSHYKAAKVLLNNVYPTVPVAGVFIARRAII